MKIFRAFIGAMVKMSTGEIVITVEYRERKLTAQWETRKIEIANFLSCLCCGYRINGAEEAYWNARAYTAGSRNAENYIELCEGSISCWDEDTGSYEFSCSGAEGGMEEIREELSSGLEEYYPDLDFECHVTAFGCGVEDYVTVCVDGRTSEGCYEYVEELDDEYELNEQYEEWLADGGIGDPPPRTLDEYYEQELKKWPKPTESDPFPIPDEVAVPAGAFGTAAAQRFFMFPPRPEGPILDRPEIETEYSRPMTLEEIEQKLKEAMTSD